jgi:hypothetical protein
MRSIVLISLFLFTVILQSSAQREWIVKDELSVTPESVMTTSGLSAPGPNVIIIPVIVHVVYNTPEQNISTAQIRSQIAVLNKDFRKKNSDIVNIPGAFKDIAGDASIEFRLATIDPSGLATDGIIRKITSVAAFGLDDKIKYSVAGGDDAWDRTKYLNLWVGNLSGGVMGYASAPGCTSVKDGVVIRYTVFGATNNLRPPYNRGRTAVHEIGHWLGLRHIWGDSPCGDDKVDDTPPQQGPTRGCPSGTIITCSSGASGNMYMNFMDFTNDECTNMFTWGQVAKMRSLFADGAPRASLLISDKASGALTDEELNVPPIPAMGKVLVYPNPAVQQVNIGFNNDEVITGKQIFIYNHLGQVSKQVAVTKSLMQINVSDLKEGVYFISTGNKMTVKMVKVN